MKKKKMASKYVRFLICGVLLFIWALDLPASAQDKFPTRPVEVIVPTAAGGGTDLMARILADETEQFLGQKIVILNKTGGSGTIGTDAIAKAKPDGYTLGCVWPAPLTEVPHVLKVTYKLEDFSYISQSCAYPAIFCVRSEFPAKTAEEFFEFVRKNPGKLTYGTDGVGNSMHFTMERLFKALKVSLRPIPYGGAGESIKALLGAHVDCYSGSIPPALPHIKAGTVRPIFVATPERASGLPDVVCATDLGHPEAATVQWRGIVGPKGIPADRFAILEKAFQKGAQTQKFRDHLSKSGESAMGSTGKQFEEFVRSENAAMAIVAKELGFSPK